MTDQYYPDRRLFMRRCNNIMIFMWDSPHGERLSEIERQWIRPYWNAGLRLRYTPHAGWWRESWWRSAVFTRRYVDLGEDYEHLMGLTWELTL